MTKKTPEGAGLKEIYTTTKRVVSKLLFGDTLKRKIAWLGYVFQTEF